MSKHIVLLSLVASSWAFYDLLLVQMWSRQICSEKTCYQSPVNYTTIHGVWPEFENATWPSYCNTSDTFDLGKIQDLVPRMNVIWPSFEGPNDGFWKHEWMKHGTCTQLQERDYFTTAIDVYDRVAPNWLRPGMNLTKSELISKLQDTMGTIPHIVCEAPHNHLRQIVTCIRGGKQIDCDHQSWLHFCESGEVIVI